ncbi:Uncharacterized protein PCOAH_00030960 [Plasmodium coatneyi]|uniref:SET domain protein n=1 Tax=Plasmodium coatneyi TaxID=208452 RepID=A0A1B1E0T4_9APIC|nr:Uncharacterized protein PCOAH_00030960 [Plasmodium coatneyi]ANQ08641.1 Uncharacterized protein PCOAH_00030960 [Plasmodium coatneyi]
MLSVSLLRDVEKRALRRRKEEGYTQKSNHPPQKNEEELKDILIELPKLHERNDKEVISALVRSFLDKNPKSVLAYELFSKFYVKIGDYKSALNLLYAALYLDQKNEKLASLLKLCEERQVSKEARIPTKYKERICYPERRKELPFPSAATLDGEGSDGRNDGRSDRSNVGSDAESSDNQPERNNLVKLLPAKQHIALAKRDMEPGEVVLQVKPLILTQHIFCNSYVYPTCYHCLKERNLSNKCYQCPVNPHTCTHIFCSWKCLAQNMKVHKEECPILPIISAAAKEAKLMLHVVLHIFRVLIKVRIDKEYKDKEQQILKDLFLNESFYQVVKANQVELFNSFNTLANRIILEFPSSFYLHLKQKELVEFMLIVWQYSLSVKYYSPSSIIKQVNPETTFGLVFSPEVAKLHHSCVPTCSFHYDEEGLITIRSICNIPQGGKLCISILSDQYVPLSVRKSFRGMARLFSCGCIRCTDSTENNLHLRSMKCPRCVQGYIYPMKTEALIEALNMEGGPNHRNCDKGDEVGKKKLANNGKDTVKEVTRKLGGDAERWLCSNCGKLSLQGNKRCVRLERSIYTQYQEAEEKYMQGDIIQAKKKLLQIHNEVQYLLHPNHHILFNVHTLLAGLMRHDHNRQLHESLIFLRKAVIAAENVLPVCSLEKVHLYAHLAHYTFDYSNHCKLYMKEGGIDAESVIEPIFASIWNAAVTTGYNSTLTIALIQQMRNYATCFNVYSPYKEMEFYLNKKEEFSHFYHHVTQKKNESYRQIRKIMKEDPFYPIYMACQCFDLDYERENYVAHIFKLFKHMQYVGNGQNALSIAASFGNVKLVKLLLRMGYSPFSKNELHMNALLHMASSFLPSEDQNLYSNYIPILLQEIESQKVQLDNFEGEYANLLNGEDKPNRRGGATLMPTQDRYANSHHYTNDIERPFPFGDLLQDEEFTYGPASSRLDNNQKIILTILLKHLDAKQMYKRRKYREKLRLNERVNLAAVGRRRKDVTHKPYGVHNSHALLSDPPSNYVTTTNKRGKSNQEEVKKGAEERSILHTGIRTDRHTVNHRRRRQPVGSEEDVDMDSSKSDNLKEKKKKKKKNFLNNTRGRNNSDESCTSPMCSSFDSGKSDDVLNNKVKHYYVQKILTKSISHKLLGLNNALHYACTRGKRKLAKQLMICGVPVKLMNSEGSTALHMASLSGHNEIVKTLLEYHTEVDAMTFHGETPLMLAAYGLHLQVVKTLVAYGAQVVLKNNDNVTVLHCLVQGLLRTHTIYYDHRAYHNDLVSAPVGGPFMKRATCKGLSSRSSHHLTAHIPIVEDLPSDLLLLPFKLLHRIKKGITILKLLVMHCPLYLYEVKDINGYNPFEMLKAAWRKVCERRICMLANADLRLSAFTDHQKNIVSQGWTLITALVNMMLSILRPDRSVLTSIYANFLGGEVIPQVGATKQGETSPTGEEKTQPGGTTQQGGTTPNGEESSPPKEPTAKMNPPTEPKSATSEKATIVPKKMWPKKAKLPPPPKKQ